MLKVRVITGDCLAAMAALARKGTIVDAVVTDPPYHLVSGNQAFDWSALAPNGSKRPNIGPTNNSGRKSGFMGQRWDGGDIAFHPETWAAMLPILKPGGYLLAFGGTRTHHRTWCAIEDAGFVIQDTIMWLYGQGFPKGRVQLKPAFEPICVAYKPGGARTLQIDECRVVGSWTRETKTRCAMNGGGYIGGVSGGMPCEPQVSHSAGRWPANVCHDGSDEVMAAFAAFGGKKGAFAPVRGTEPSVPFSKAVKFSGMERTTPGSFYADTGTAARFFYCAKASKAERAGSKHPTVKPIALMRWLVRLVTLPGGLVLDPFAGSGTTGAAARAEGRKAILIEREPEYVADIKRPACSINTEF